ncbi:ABC transporter ATP-binding protein [Magnetococcales bacterium HHB-1]
MSFKQFPAYFKLFRFSPRTVAILLFFQITSVLFESLGLTLLLPVFQFIQAKGDVVALAHESPIWAWLVQFYQMVGLTISLEVLLLTSFASLIIRQAATYGRLVFNAKETYKLTAQVRSRGFARFMRAQINYCEKAHLGDLVNDLTIELDRAINCLFLAVVFLGYLFQLLLYTGILATISWSMTLVSLVTLTLLLPSLRKLMTRSVKVGKKITHANRSMSTFLVERLRAVRLVRLSRTERAEIDAMAMLNHTQRDHIILSRILKARVAVTIDPMVASLGLMLLYGGVTYFGLSIEEIGFYIVIIVRLLPVVKELMITRQGILSTYPSVEAVRTRLLEMHQQREALLDQQTKDCITLSHSRLHEGIQFKHVSFTYATSTEPALKEISLSIPAGKITALAGPSGSGKSTLIDLLPRLREPDSGEIFIENQPLRCFTLDHLRQHIGFVPQSPQIFNVTLEAHMRYGRPDASPEALTEAVERAGMTAFVDHLPEGLMTEVGEEGERLSGGQRQRLDLARALLQNPAVLILDEPTSNLDPESERVIRQALILLRNRLNVTIILVAHKWSALSIADQVAVLHNGRIVDLDTPDALLKRPGWFQRTFLQEANNQL